MSVSVQCFETAFFFALLNPLPPTYSTPPLCFSLSLSLALYSLSYFQTCCGPFESRASAKGWPPVDTQCSTCKFHVENSQEQTKSDFFPLLLPLHRSILNNSISLPVIIISTPLDIDLSLPGSAEPCLGLQGLTSSNSCESSTQAFQFSPAATAFFWGPFSPSHRRRVHPHVSKMNISGSDPLMLFSSPIVYWLTHDVRSYI